MKKGPYKMKAGEEGPMKKNFGISPVKNDFNSKHARNERALKAAREQDKKLANEKNVFGDKKPEFTNIKNVHGENLSTPNIKNMKYNKSREDYIKKTYKIIGNKK